jgi:hypothetical protein
MYNQVMYRAFSDELQKIAAESMEKDQALKDILPAAKKVVKKVVGTPAGGTFSLNPGSGVRGLIGRTFGPAV